MKILYAVQATGNGHISRAHQLFPYLSEYGEVDIFLSGSNANLPMNIPVKYRSKGLSLFYSQCGGLNYWNTFNGLDTRHIYKMVRDLPVEKYDLIINDFDFITSGACRLKKIKSVQFGHQASFQSIQSPRPENRSFIGEMVLKNYAPAQSYVGLHFENYDDFIFNPVIKKEFIECTPENHGHISVYLPAYQSHCIEKALRSISNFQFHWFLPEIEIPVTKGNITYFPIRQQFFNESLIYCHGLITGGGFETPSEALFLEKKLMSIPIKGQYEQQCNAAALKKLGVEVLEDCGPDFSKNINNWLRSDPLPYTQKPNNISDTLDYIMNL